MLEYIGWIATAVFSTSYFLRNDASLRRLQAAAACLWIVYGVSIRAYPVIIANLIVAAAAMYSQFRRPGGSGSDAPGRFRFSRAPGPADETLVSKCPPR